MRTVTAALVLLAGAAFADVAPPAQAPAKADAGGPAAEPAPATPKRTPEQLANLRKLILDGLADSKTAARAESAEILLVTWPDSAPILDEALASKAAAVRIEAVQLLGREELGDVRPRIRERFSDTNPTVRMHAIRVARRLDWPEAEPDYIRRVTGDSEWIVCHEALRALEDRGTAACLAAVFAGWSHERDADRRRRHHRVLVKVVGADHGDDEEAWKVAIEKALRPEFAHPAK